MGFNEDKLAEGYRQKGTVGIDLAMELDDLRRHLAQVEWTFSVIPGTNGGWELTVFELGDGGFIYTSGECPTIVHAITMFRRDEACPPNRENVVA